MTSSPDVSFENFQPNESTSILDSTLDCAIAGLRKCLNEYHGKGMVIYHLFSFGHLNKVRLEALKYLLVINFFPTQKRKCYGVDTDGLWTCFVP